MSNHTVTNSESTFTSVLLQYTVATLPYVILGSVNEALINPGRLQGVAYRDPGAQQAFVVQTVTGGVNRDMLFANQNGALPLAPYNFNSGDQNYHLRTFAETMNWLGNDLMSRSLIPVVTFCANMRYLGELKFELGEVVTGLLGVDGRQWGQNSIRKILFTYNNEITSIDVLSGIGVATMGAAKLYSDTNVEGNMPVAQIAFDSIGFALLALGTSDLHLSSSAIVGDAIVNTAIYAGALATRHMLDTFTQTTNVTASDFAVLGSAGQFIAFLGFKGPAIIGGTISPLIPALLVAMATQPMMDVKIDVYTKLATACAGTLANSLRDFYEVPADQVSVSGLPFGILVFTAAIAAPLLKPLHYPSDVGAAAKYSYVFFSSLALLEATASLVSVLTFMWFSSDATDGSAAGYEVGTDAGEVIAADDEAVAAPIDAHAGEL